MNDISKQKDNILKNIHYNFNNIAYNDDLSISIQELLKITGEYYQGDRAYFIMTFDGEINLFNTYEWCFDGIDSELNMLDILPLQELDCWQKLLEKIPVYYITKNTASTTEAKLLKEWDIDGIIISKVYAHDHFMGYVTVDNPAHYSTTFLHNVSAYIGRNIESSVSKEVLDNIFAVGDEPVVDTGYIVKNEITIERNIKVDKIENILIVEDNDINADMVAEILGDLGYNTDWAHDGQECIDMLLDSEDGKYDLIFMDVQMPRLDGYETTVSIRRFTDMGFSKIPIIAVTGSSSKADIIKALNSGMNGHIAKPINADAIKFAIDRLIAK